MTPAQREILLDCVYARLDAVHAGTNTHYPGTPDEHIKALYDARDFLLHVESEQLTWTQPARDSRQASRGARSVERNVDR